LWNGRIQPALAFSLFKKPTQNMNERGNGLGNNNIVMRKEKGGFIAIRRKTELSLFLALSTLGPN